MEQEAKIFLDIIKSANQDIKDIKNGSLSAEQKIDFIFRISILRVNAIKAGQKYYPMYDWINLALGETNAFKESVLSTYRIKVNYKLNLN